MWLVYNCKFGSYISNYLEKNKYKVCYKDIPFEISDEAGRKILLTRPEEFRRIEEEEIRKIREKGRKRVYKCLMVCDESLGDNIMSIVCVNKILKLKPNYYFEIVTSPYLVDIWKPLAEKFWTYQDYVSVSDVIRLDSFSEIFVTKGEGMRNTLGKSCDRNDVFANSCGIKLEKSDFDNLVTGIKPYKTNSVALVIRSNTHRRTWDTTMKKQYELAKRIANCGIRVEIHDAHKFEIFDNLGKNVENLTGKLKLIEHCNRLAGSNFVINCGDTGGTHVAGIFKVPQISMYGVVKPQWRLKYYPNSYGFWKKVCKIQACEYRMKEYKSEICNDIQCMREISVDEVYAKFMEMYNS